MLTMEELTDAVTKLEQCNTCAVHGSQYMMICEHCWMTVQCEACSVQTCQCWNDE